MQIRVDTHGARPQHGAGGPDGRRGKSDSRLRTPQRRVGTDHEPSQCVVLHGHSQYIEMHTEQHSDTSQGVALYQYSRRLGEDL